MILPVRLTQSWPGNRVTRVVRSREALRTHAHPRFASAISSQGRSRGATEPAASMRNSLSCSTLKGSRKALKNRNCRSTVRSKTLNFSSKSRNSRNTARSRKAIFHQKIRRVGTRWDQRAPKIIEKMSQNRWICLIISFAKNVIKKCKVVAKIMIPYGCAKSQWQVLRMKNHNYRLNPSWNIVAEIVEKTKISREPGPRRKRTLRARSVAAERSSKSDGKCSWNRCLSSTIDFKRNRLKKCSTPAKTNEKTFVFQRCRGYATKSTLHPLSSAPQRASQTDGLKSWNRWFLSMIILMRKTSQKMQRRCEKCRKNLTTPRSVRPCYKK